MKKAIVLPAHVAGLGVIRSLGKMDVPVVAMHYEEREMGYVSKHVVQSIHVPHPVSQEADFIGCLIEHGHVCENGILIPTDDSTVSAISRNKEILEQYYIVAVPEWEIVRKIIIKKHTYEVAKSIGIPHPKTFVPRAVTEIAKIGEQLDFPCLVKPCEVHKFFDVFGRKMFRVENQDQLRIRFSQAHELGLEVMIQEMIPGDDRNGINYNSYFIGDKPVAEFTARKVRLDPPRFGSPRVLVSQKIPEIIETGRELLKALRFYGFSCTEFKKDERDGLYKLMEVNGRHNLTTTLAVACGINFPWIMYQHLWQNRVIIADDFKTNVYWIDITKDALHSVFSRDQERFSIHDYIKPYISPKVFGVFSFGDPRPIIKRLSYMLIRGLRVVMKKIRFGRTKLNTVSRRTRLAK